MDNKKQANRLETYKTFIDDFKSIVDTVSEKSLLEKSYTAFLKTNTQLKKAFRTDTTRARYTAADMCSEAIKKYNEKIKSLTGK